MEENKMLTISENKVLIDQIHVIYSSGSVLVSRKYKKGCIDKDNQLVGAFLSAITMFASSISNSSNCDFEYDTEHTIRDIGMTCGRWFLKSFDNFIIAVFVSNCSDLVQNSEYDLIDEICDKILDSFMLLHLLTSEGEFETSNIFSDYSEDFGKSIDHLLFESLYAKYNEEVSYLIGEEIVIVDPAINSNLALGGVIQ